ncbi:PRC-barrel domain-containing protein [Azoarcus sp. PA01]|nr:PRC-barrel domain-containing protein [Azoarcus sp. PA01]
MSSIYRKSLLAGALAALVAVPIGAVAGSYTEGQTKHQMRSPMGAAGQVQSMTPSQLRGTEVVDASGEQIGSVKTVVRSRHDENIHAVISAGGFLGVGDREITVPLNRMRYEDGKLRLSAGVDELRAGPEYRPEQYVELRPMDQPISEFSALEPMPDESTRYRGEGTSWDIERSADPNAPYPEGWRVTP